MMMLEDHMRNLVHNNLVNTKHSVNVFLTMKLLNRSIKRSSLHPKSFLNYNYTIFSWCNGVGLLKS